MCIRDRCVCVCVCVLLLTTYGFHQPTYFWLSFPLPIKAIDCKVCISSFGRRQIRGNHYVSSRIDLRTSNYSFQHIRAYASTYWFPPSPRNVVGNLVAISLVRHSTWPSSLCRGFQNHPLTVASKTCSTEWFLPRNVVGKPWVMMNYCVGSAFIDYLTWFMCCPSIVSLASGSVPRGIQVVSARLPITLIYNWIRGPLMC